MRAVRVALAHDLAYWTVVDDQYRRVVAADSYLRHLRLGMDRAAGTTKAYAEDLAFFLGWCERSGRSLDAGAADLALFVLELRTTPVTRAGSGRGSARSGRRINHILTAVREMYKHAVATRRLDGAVLSTLYEVGDDRYLPAELRPEESGLRYRARPRHVQRVTARATPKSVRHDEFEAVFAAATSWRTRFLIALLWFSGLRIGEVLGLRRSDMHLLASSRALDCEVAGSHLHVVRRDNPNGACAKSGARHVPVPATVVGLYDRYLGERERCPAAEGCDFVLVNLFHPPLGRPMSYASVRDALAGLARKAGLARSITPHMFRHATATELLARGAGLDVVKEILGHASILSTQVYAHPDRATLRAAVDSLASLQRAPSSQRGC